MVDDVLYDVLNESDIINELDLGLILACLCIGFLIKHLCNKISNQIIPFIITGFCVFVTMSRYISCAECTYTNACDAIISAVIYSAISIGLHTNGKQFKKLILKNTKKTMDSISEELEEIEEKDA